MNDLTSKYATGFERWTMAQWTLSMVALFVCKRIGRVSDYERGLMLFRLNIGAFIHSIYKGDMRTPTKKCCHLPSKSTTKQHRGCAYLMHPYLWSLTLMTSSAKWWCSEKGHRRSWLVIHMIFTVFSNHFWEGLVFGRFLEGFWKTWMYNAYLFVHFTHL